MTAVQSPPTVHALLIGIDHYLPPEDRSKTIYSSLRGCVRDVERVERWLLDLVGVDAGNIKKLVAPLGPAPGLDQPEFDQQDMEPTYENIVAALQQLQQQAQAGDYVWIHYSGHGGRVPTLFRDVKSSAVDETLVPTNIGDPSARHLRDVELASLLEDLADANLTVTVVLDCCHSGGAIRKENSASFRRERGSDTLDTTRRPEASLVGSSRKISQRWRAVRKNSRRGLEAKSCWRFEPDGYVLLAACRAHERALEDLYDGVHPGGALTHWLLDCLAALPRPITYRQVYNRLAAMMAQQDPGQTPQLEGPGHFFVLEPGEANVAPSVSVLKIDPSLDRVLLNMGLAQALRPGVFFGVFPPGGTVFNEDAAVAVVELTECGATASWARRISGQMERIEIGAPAVELGPKVRGSAPLRWSRRPRQRVRAVRLSLESSAFGASSRRQALDKVREAVWGDAVLDALPYDAPEDEPADFEVVATPHGLEIRDHQGGPVSGIEPLSYRKDRVERFIAWRLVHLSRFMDVLELSNHGEPALPGGGLELELELFRLRDGCEVNPTEADLIPLGDGPLRAGEWVCLKIRNASRQVLNVALLNLQFSCWSIEQIHPIHAEFRPFEWRQQELLPFRLTPASGINRHREVFKALGTVDAPRFRQLQLPPIHQPNRGTHSSLEWTHADWTVRDLSFEMTSGGG